MTSSIHIRIDADLKTEAESVFQEIGLDATTAVRMFYKKVVNTRSIPFELKAEDTRLEALLLDGLDSPATELEDNWADKMKSLVRERLAARKTHG